MKRKIFAFTFLTLYILITGFNCNVYGNGSGKIIVLLYHHLLKDSENTNKGNSSVVSVENFEKQMEYLHNNGYNTITAELLSEYLKFKKSLPKKSILITFDDGYKSNYEYAYPILKKYGFNASIFIVTGLIPDKPQDFDPNRLSYMSRKEIEKSKDVFEYACHTHNLHKLDSNGESVLLSSDRADIIKDLRTSRQLVPTKFLSYPYGQYNKQIKDILSEEGFELAFTVNKGAVNTRSNRLELNRVPVFYDTSIYDFKKILNSPF